MSRVLVNHLRVRAGPSTNTPEAPSFVVLLPIIHPFLETPQKAIVFDPGVLKIHGPLFLSSTPTP